MNKNKITIIGRVPEYTYLIYRGTQIPEILHGQDPATPPSFTLESFGANFIVDAEASGLGLPEVRITQDTEGPFVEVATNKGETYYYAMYAKEGSTILSNPAIVSSTLKQPKEQVSHLLEKTSGTLIQAFQDKTELNPFVVCEPSVPGLVAEDIVYDLSQSIISGEVIINIPNVWYDINRIYNYRQYFPLNIYATSGGLKSSPYRLFTEGEKTYVPIDKIEVLRMKVQTEDSTPLDSNAEGVEIRNLIVREGGVYYHAEYSALPKNMMNRHGIVSVYRQESTTRILELKDGVEASCLYKYTIRLFDGYKRSSIPTVFNIRT